MVTLGNIYSPCIFGWSLIITYQNMGIYILLFKKIAAFFLFCKSTKGNFKIVTFMHRNLVT